MNQIAPTRRPGRARKSSVSLVTILEAYGPDRTIIAVKELRNRGRLRAVDVSIARGITVLAEWAVYRRDDLERVAGLLAEMRAAPPGVVQIGGEFWLGRICEAIERELPLDVQRALGADGDAVGPNRRHA